MPKNKFQDAVFTVIMVIVMVMQWFAITFQQIWEVYQTKYF